LWLLLKSKEPPAQAATADVEAEKSRVVAKRELEAFTLLQESYLEDRKGKESLAGEPPAPTVAELKDRYLLVKVKRRGEVKREMVAPREATLLLADAVAVTLPATVTNFFGSQLRTGDLVDLLAVRAGGTSATATAAQPGAGVTKFENLLVLNAPGDVAKAVDKECPAGSITLALPRAWRDDFASALAGATLLVTRKIPVRSQ
jgi:hypothetical protein